MRLFFPTLVLVCSGPFYIGQQAVPSATAPPTNKTNSSPAIALDKEAIQNSNKAKSIIEEGIKALGGDTYLNIRDREQQGRGYAFHHGRPSGAGGLIWSFFEFPDKERVELTKDRDIAEVFVGEKGYEITYKGPHALEQKDLEDYLRRRRFSLDTVLRNWINDPTVV